MAQTFSKGMLLLSYYANTRAYAEHCINKAKPKLHCNGKCQLAKKIQQEENKEQKNLLKSVPEIILINQNAFASVPCLWYAAVVESKHLLLTIGDTNDVCLSFFHPPDRQA